MNILIVGTGVIARELKRLIQQKYDDWRVEFFSSKRDRHSFDIAVGLSDIVFVAISTKDNGLAAAQYIQEALQLGKYVVTCEKGALSEYFHVIRPYMEKVGYNTTVGGASFILNLLKQPGTIRRMTAVINGSCNNVSSLVEQGLSVEEAVRKTQKDSYTEPGECSPHDIVNDELVDACRKAVILYNFANPEHSIKHSTMSQSVFSEDGIHHLFTKRPDQDYSRRLIIDIGLFDNTGIYRYHAGIRCFWARTETHYIQGSFRDPTWCFPMIPRGVQNCLRIEYADGKADFRYGIGAGVTETAQAMIVDAERLLGSN